jgi:anti-sigma B factor antagonist
MHTTTIVERTSQRPDQKNEKMELFPREVNGVAVLELKGQFVNNEKCKVYSWIEQSLEQGVSRLVINLSGVTFIDTIAIGTLISGKRHCRQQKGDLRLCHLQQPVKSIFEMMCLDQAFTFFDQEEAAIHAPW